MQYRAELEASGSALFHHENDWYQGQSAQSLSELRCSARWERGPATSSIGRESFECEPLNGLVEMVERRGLSGNAKMALCKLHD